MMYFKFKQHPGDFLRDASIHSIPDPISNQEDFWLWFHPSYQSSPDIADLDDLHKLLHDECSEDDLVENEFYKPYIGLCKLELKRGTEINRIGQTASDQLQNSDFKLFEIHQTASDELNQPKLKSHRTCTDAIDVIPSKRQ